MSARHLPLVVALLTAALAFGANDAAGGEPVEVRLASGRVFHGEIDRRTDDDTLWLRFTWDHTVILRPVAWNRVTSATIGSQQLSGTELKNWTKNSGRPADAAPAPSGPATAKTAGRVAHAVIVARVLSGSDQPQLPLPPQVD